MIEGNEIWIVMIVEVGEAGVDEWMRYNEKR